MHEVTKKSVFALSNSLVVYAPENSDCVLLAKRTIPVQPMHMQNRPVKSNLGTSYSPRTKMDSKTEKTMPTVAFTAIKVKSRKGRTMT